jgi:hypothetical protein
MSRGRCSAGSSWVVPAVVGVSPHRAAASSGVAVAVCLAWLSHAFHWKNDG